MARRGSGDATSQAHEKSTGATTRGVRGVLRSPRPPCPHRSRAARTHVEVQLPVRVAVTHGEAHEVDVRGRRGRQRGVALLHRGDRVWNVVAAICTDEAAGGDKQTA